MISVYRIKIDGVTRYIGHSNDLKRRAREHNTRFKKGYKKHLYDALRAIEYDGELVLELLTAYKSKVEAKRYECLLILSDHFSDKNLWQKVPNISDR